MLLTHSEVYLHTGVQPHQRRSAARPVRLWQDPTGECDWLRAPRTDLFFFLAKSTSLIQELGLPFISISAPSIVSGM